MKKIKRLLSMLLVCCLAVGLLPTTAFAADAATSVQIGDYIELGTYLGEPIRWRCIDIDSNGPLMLSDKVLCLKAYDAKGDSSIHYVPGSFFSNQRKSYGSNCWKDSNLREWLNSNDSNVAWSHDVPNSNNIYNGYNPYDDEAGFLTNFTQEEFNCIKQITHKVYTNEAEATRGVVDGGSTEFVIDDGTVMTRPSNLSGKYYQNVTDFFFLLCTGTGYLRKRDKPGQGGKRQENPPFRRETRHFQPGQARERGPFCQIT